MHPRKTQILENGVFFVFENVAANPLSAKDTNNNETIYHKFGVDKVKENIRHWKIVIFENLYFQQKKSFMTVSRTRRVNIFLTCYVSKLCGFNAYCYLKSFMTELRFVKI